MELKQLNVRVNKSEYNPYVISYAENNSNQITDLTIITKK